MAAAPHFSTRVDCLDGVAHIALIGELDIVTVPILERQLAVFEDVGVGAITLDLRGLTFMDSSGVHAFTEAKDRAHANGRDLILVGERPSVRRLLHVTGTGSLLGV